LKGFSFPPNLFFNVKASRPPFLEIVNIVQFRTALTSAARCLILIPCKNALKTGLKTTMIFISKSSCYSYWC